MGHISNHFHIYLIFKCLISKFWCTLLFQVNGHLRSSATFESHFKCSSWGWFIPIYTSISHQLLVMLWSCFVCENSPVGQILEWIIRKLLPKCFSECCSRTFFDPTWWLGLEMVCVTQVARWSLNSMANWPRDSRLPRRRRHVTSFWGWRAT